MSRHLHSDNHRLVEQGRMSARPLLEPKDLQEIVERIKDAKVVMLGEASHGTHEFYEWRRLISEWLIVKHGFRFIAVEGDWPASRQLDHFIQGKSPGMSPRNALRGFRRWPTWMWANNEVKRLATWLRQHNELVPLEHKVGFHGLDVYSIFESMNAVTSKLEKINPFLAKKSRQRYSCFDPFGGDEIAYAKALRSLPKGCTEEVTAMLGDLLRLRLEGDDRDSLFDAQQNARVVANAEHYYRTMIHADEASWNVRDEHMMETLELLLAQYGPDAKAIVWAHNSHIGDHDFTSMKDQGLVNLGGLARERLGNDKVALIGFGTHSGTVIASHAWDGPVEVKLVPEGRKGSVEDAFHDIAYSIGSANFTLWMDESARSGPMAEWRPHRAIGVVFEPEHERWGNYVPTSLAMRYDGFIFLDRTHALEPLMQEFDRRALPETWPAGQ